MWVWARTQGVKLLPLIALLAFVAFAPPSTARTRPQGKQAEPSYSVTFVIKNPNDIHYSSTSNLHQGGGCESTTIEDDRFHASAVYSPLRIPRTGPGPNNVNLTAKETTTDEAAHDRKVTGSSTGCPANATYTCHGSLRIDTDEPPKMISSPGITEKELHLDVELAKVVRFENGAGSLEPFGCGHTFDGDNAFEPASDDGYMPDMLRAKVDLSLKDMRALKSGEQFSVPVELAQPDAPPPDCSGGDTTCNEELQWKGEIVVRRL